MGDVVGDDLHEVLVRAVAGIACDIAHLVGHGVAFQIQPARPLVVGRDQVEVRGVVLCLMQDVGELMMHRLEEPLIEEIYARAGRIQTVDVVECDLQSALRGSKHDGSLVEGLGADELDHPRAVCLYEGVAEQLVVGVDPQVLRQLGHRHGLVIFSRDQVVVVVGLTVDVLVVELNIIGFHVVEQQPGVKRPSLR